MESQIIIPPEDIKKIILTTANYVRSNGADFEFKVQQEQKDNLKFSFLQSTHPYRKFYESIVKYGEKYEEKLKIEMTAQEIRQNFSSQDKKKLLQQGIAYDLTDYEHQQNRFVLNAHKNLTPQDLDVIKTVSQFVAKNGASFLIELTKRERQNVLFEFLRPNSENHQLFQDLIQSYRYIIDWKQKDTERLQRYNKDKDIIYNRAIQRFGYEFEQKQRQKRKEEIEIEESSTVNQIDWNDFIVVETIEFDDQTEQVQPIEQETEEEKLRKKKEKDDLLYQREKEKYEIQKQKRMIQQQLKEQKAKEQKQAEIEFQNKLKAEIDAKLLLKSSLTNQTEQNQRQLATTGENIEIREDYQRAQYQTSLGQTKCPITGQMIDIDKFNEHIRMLLLNPEYMQIKKELESRLTNLNMANSDEIAKNLTSLKQDRPDIFGGSVQNLKYQEKHSSQLNQIWDGQSNVMTRTTANLTMVQTMQNKRNLELLNMQQSQKAQQKNYQINEPSQYTDSKIEAGVKLELEEQWLLKNNKEIKLGVRLPDDKHYNANFKGQQVQILIHPSFLVYQIKKQISEKLGEFNINECYFKSPVFNCIDDNKTVAYYNLVENTKLELKLKN